MSAHVVAAHLDVAATRRRIVFARAAAALVWAAAIAVTAGDPGTDLSTGLALLVTAYPVIDVLASLAEASHGGEAATRLRINAIVSSIAVVGLAVAAFGSDVGSVLAVFGSWAIASGLILFYNANKRRRQGSRELSLLVSGGLSTVAGVLIVASSNADNPNLNSIAGYATSGAVLFLVWAFRTRTSS
ncbi:MAG TPA: hypothetical protein VGQ38_02710 [Gaiellaceae bacterium]|jgi:hypothetical protein|nr:hypothetical protein [Gaiellaceae bacterium]